MTLSNLTPWNLQISKLLQVQNLLIIVKSSFLRHYTTETVKKRNDELFKMINERRKSVDKQKQGKGHMNWSQNREKLVQQHDFHIAQNHTNDTWRNQIHFYFSSIAHQFADNSRLNRIVLCVKSSFIKLFSLLIKCKSNLLNGNSCNIIPKTWSVPTLMLQTWSRKGIITVVGDKRSGKENSFTWTMKIFGCFPIGKFFSHNYPQEYFFYITKISELN